MFDTITIYTSTDSNTELSQDKICTMGFIETINSTKAMFEE